jgi:stage V sporulation protein SpoVS
VPHSTTPSLSGALYLRTERVFRQVVGDGAVDQAFASLSSEHQQILESAVPAAWIPVAVIDVFYEAIARCAGQDLNSFYPEVVQLGITQALRSVWKVLMRLTTDRALLSRTPIIYARGHSVGRIQTTIDAPGKATVVLSGWPGVPELRRVGVGANIQAVMDVAGRKGVSVRYDRTVDGAVYHVRWQP